VILSPSLCEGFNLPLLEAQALGTMTQAFYTGAHPEVTPFIYGGLAEMEGLLLGLNQGRALLAQYSAEAYRFVLERFNWGQTADELMQLLGSLPPHFRFYQPLMRLYQ
jgi:glycosyltransferase involved in cell wall biosynthesis